ncbi:hypothetical protein HDU76_002234 [Blyttiomyces sp. JEL0837]|nr:hypothetical protein HDU76_002234 [Blyttiomyces sp. JEL0837]
MLQKLNIYRAYHGLHPLTLDARLVDAADKHSWDMDTAGVLVHDDMIGDEDIWYDRVGSFVADWATLAENIGWGTHSEDEMLQIFKNSPEHNRNMLSKTATHFGASKSDLYWTQDFASYLDGEGMVEPFACTNSWEDE